MKHVRVSIQDEAFKFLSGFLLKLRASLKGSSLSLNDSQASLCVYHNGVARRHPFDMEILSNLPSLSHTVLLKERRGLCRPPSFLPSFLFTHTHILHHLFQGPFACLPQPGPSSQFVCVKLRERNFLERRRGGIF